MSTIQDMKDMLDAKLAEIIKDKRDEYMQSALGVDESRLSPPVVPGNDDAPNDEKNKEASSLQMKAGDDTKPGPVRNKTSTASIDVKNAGK
jgi:hypothetical protein